MFARLQTFDRKEFTSWTEFCLHQKPFGLGRSPEDIETIIREAKDPKILAEFTTPLAEHGEIGNGRSRGYQSTSTSRETSNKYRTAKLARDAPEVFTRMQAGEFKTVAEAEKAAGFPKRERREVWLSAQPVAAAEKLVATFPQREKTSVSPLFVPHAIVGAVASLLLRKIGNTAWRFWLWSAGGLWALPYS